MEIQVMAYDTQNNVTGLYWLIVSLNRYIQAFEVTNRNKYSLKYKYQLQAKKQFKTRKKCGGVIPANRNPLTCYFQIPRSQTEIPFKFINISYNKISFKRKTKLSAL